MHALQGSRNERCAEADGDQIERGRQLRRLLTDQRTKAGSLERPESDGMDSGAVRVAIDNEGLACEGL